MLVSSERSQLMQVKRFIPFSVGPRDCIGQNLAKVNYQTTVPMLLSQFSFKLAEEVLTPSKARSYRAPPLCLD